MRERFLWQNNAMKIATAIESNRIGYTSSISIAAKIEIKYYYATPIRRYVHLAAIYRYGNGNNKQHQHEMHETYDHRKLMEHITI